MQSNRGKQDVYYYFKKGPLCKALVDALALARYYQSLLEVPVFIYG
jgi:hypothetical protein